MPFLDSDLIDFAMYLPVAYKLGNLGAVVRLNENEPGSKTKRYFERTNDGKLLLRKVLRRYVGSEAVQREKQGFSAPDESWFRGESMDYVRDRLLDRTARIYDWTDYDSVTGLVGEHLSGERNHCLLIWSLLYVEEWSRRFLGAQAHQARAVSHGVADIAGHVIPRRATGAAFPGNRVDAYTSCSSAEPTSRAALRMRW